MAWTFLNFLAYSAHISENQIGSEINEETIKVEVDPNDHLELFHGSSKNQIESSSETVSCQNVSTIKEEPAMNEKEILSNFNNVSYDGDGAGCDVVIKQEIENQIGDTIG